MLKNNKQKEKSFISKLTSIVQNVTNQCVTFGKLEYSKKIEVLNYIKEHNLCIKAFERKWYDILTNKFYTIEFIIKDGTIFGKESIIKEFGSFNDFFVYVDGNIYEDSCFYGYTFSNEEISRFEISINLVNFDSFINKTINSHTFELVRKSNEKRNDSKIEKTMKMIEYLEQLHPISTYSDLESEYKKFRKKFFRVFDYYNIFFSYVLRRYKSELKDAAIEYALKQGEYDNTLTFDDILLRYGNEVDLHSIINLPIPSRYQNQTKKIRNFKETLEKYENEELFLQRRLGFDENLQLYYVSDMYYDNNKHLLKTSEYFIYFSEFVSYVNGDLSNANLLNAPISCKDVEMYKVNDHTKFPLSKQYQKYEVKKYFAKKKFIVAQEWIDENGIKALEGNNEFDYFFDFVHFLKGDLSNADLILCEGIENIIKLADLKIDGIKVRSEVANKLVLSLIQMEKNIFATRSFECSSKYELETINNFLVKHPDDTEYLANVSYIADIHLLHRFDAYKCKTLEDVEYVIRKIAMTLGEEATPINLICGDTASNIDIFKMFVKELFKYRKNGDFFFTLGNHELWNQKNETLYSIIEKYRNILKEEGCERMHLVHNNIYYLDNGWNEISENELQQISKDDLRKKTRSSKVVIFGGLGFAGMNDKFNADNGIYLDVLNRNDEKNESVKFLTLYEKVICTLNDKNLIVMSHMPMRDWGGMDIHAKEFVVYVNGHSHRNYFYDDGKKRIYADNQVGYNGKNLSFKRFSIDLDYDWFSDYNDGIYEISKKDYEKFYRGFSEIVTFNRKYDKLFMIKRNKTYMFLMRSVKGNMLILNGGLIKNAGNHSLEYFYENLVKYSLSVSLFLSKYNKLQEFISNEVKKIGGNGKIHGSIVDIDFYNHIYINPLDSSITPYFANSMVDKYVYKNVQSLLKNNCPTLYVNYIKRIEQSSHEKEMNNVFAFNDNIAIDESTTHVTSTEMYKISRIIKGLQYTTKYNIIRLWNDAIVADVSEDNGKLIVSGIINPNLQRQKD